MLSWVRNALSDGKCIICKWLCRSDRGGASEDGFGLRLLTPAEKYFLLAGRRLDILWFFADCKLLEVI